MAASTDDLQFFDLSHRWGHGMPQWPSAPLLNLKSGYVQRVAGMLPQQGTTSPWTIRQNWFLDARDSRRTDLDEAMIWTREKGVASSGGPLGGLRAERR